MKPLAFSDVRFLKSVLEKEQWPTLARGVPEIALVGRSNVGKSSLLNLLFGRKLAEVSAMAGKTQMLCFYTVDQHWSFVDLPGYGFAKAPKEVQERWVGAIDRYLQEREELTGILWLVDLRREPTEQDVAFWRWAKAMGKRVIVVFTKADQVKEGQWIKQASRFFAALEPLPHLFTSALKKQGRTPLIQAVMELVHDATTR